jgi:DNA repair protein RadD
MTDLRPYQKEAVDKIQQSKHNRLLVVSPTGSGKTHVANALMTASAAEFKHSLLVVHRREIILQTRDKLKALGVNPGVIMAGELPDLLASVQLAAIQTLHARAIRSERMKIPLAHLLVIDEAHRACAETYKKVIAAYPDAKIVGLTATPCRGDGRGLGGIFDELIELPQVPDLIEAGYLVPTVNFGPQDVDLRGIETRQGDYVVGQLARRMNTAPLVGNIVVHWLKYSERRKTVIFAVDVAHSVHIRDELIKAGVRAEHIDGDTPKAQRDETLARLARGEIEVVCNCMVLTEGWDMPEVGCCVLARPTKQMGLYRQMVGRVLRPSPGKTNAIVIDHSGAVNKLGFVEDRIEWTLDPEGRAKNATQRKREATGGDRIVECSQCDAMRQGGKACPNCGFLPQTRPNDYLVRDGELGRIDRHGTHKPAYSAKEREQWYAMLRGYGEERGRKEGWAFYSYVAKFGEEPPPNRKPRPITPTPEVRAWARSRDIASPRPRKGTLRGQGQGMPPHADRQVRSERDRAGIDQALPPPLRTRDAGRGSDVEER